MAIIQYRGEQYNPDFVYEVGVDVDHALAVVDRKVLYVSPLNYHWAKRHVEGWRVEVWEKDLLKQWKGKRVGLSFPYHSAGFVEKLKSLGVDVYDVSKRYRRKRRRKRAGEVALVKRAEREALKVLEEAREEVKPGMKERDVERLLLCLISERGEAAFHPIVAGDGRSRFPHYRASALPFRKMVLLDFGVRWKGYNSDITEVLVWEPSLEKEWEQLKAFFRELLEEVEEKAPMTVRGFNRLAHRRLKERGWSMPHSIGHGIGLEVHESPFSNERVVLKETIMAVEPAFYHRYGMRFEREVWFNAEGKPRLLNPQGF